jgi:hypothetical protein
MARMISYGGYGLTPQAYEGQATGGLVGRLRNLLEQQGAASSSTYNQSNGSTQGLLGRLLAPDAANGAPDGGFGQELLSQPKERNFRQLSRVSDGPIAPSIALSDLSEALQHAPSIIPQADGSRSTGPSYRQYAMGKPTYSQCVDQCLHLLPSPSGDLQSSEFRMCVGKCMGRL